MAIVATPRMFARLADEGQPPIGKRIWGARKMALPHDFPGKWRNVFTGETLLVQRAGSEKVISLEKLFSSFPVALLDPIPG